MSTLTADSTATLTNKPALAGKYLTVVLEDEAYGIAVLKVREISPLLSLRARVRRRR